MGRSFEKYLGFNAEIVGEGLKKIFLNPNELERIERTLVEKEVVLNEEVILLTKAGNRAPVTLSAAPRRDEEGNIIGYFFALLDISERKKFEQELKDRIEDLERFQRLAVGRELRIVELKKEVGRLKQTIEDKGRQKNNT